MRGNTKDRQECGAAGTLTSCWRGCELVQPLGETVLQYLLDPPFPTEGEKPWGSVGLRDQQRQTGQGVGEGEADFEEASFRAESNGDHR